MTPELIVTVIVGLFGSNVLTGFISVFTVRRKNESEATERTVQTVLALEERAHNRYATTSVALDEAEKLLKFARKQLADQEDYIDYLQCILRSCEQEFLSREEHKANGTVK